MTKRSPVSAPQPVFYDSMQVDETDLQTQQTANTVVESATLNNHIGTGVLPETLIPNILFDSNLATGFLDGLAIQPQAQPSDNNLGNQLSISLTGSDASIYRTVKLGIIGLDFQSNLQYEIFVFKANEVQVSAQHFTKILVLLFNDLQGNPTISFNLGGDLVISEAQPMQLSRDTIMIAQDVEPNLFFRDFFIDPSLGPISLQTMLRAAMPTYNITNLNIMTQPLDNLVLASGDVTTQIGQKFQATTNNIQKITLLLSVRNLVAGQQNNLVWAGDLIVSIYPLQTTVNCPSNLAPGLPILFSPSNIPIAQISYDYDSLMDVGLVLDSVPQPIDFVFSNTPAAVGNLVVSSNYYCVAINRAGNANQCDILVAVGGDDVANSNACTFTGDLWVDLPTEDLWFRVWTDASKVADGQAYDTGLGVTIPKTTLDIATQATIDYSFGPQQFVGSDTFRAVLTANNVESDPVPDARTGEPVESRQQLEPQVTLLGTVDITNLENTTEPLVLGAIADKNIKTFSTSTITIDANLYTATMVNNTMLIRIVDDPTDTVRFDTSVTALTTDLLNGQLVSAQFTPDDTKPSIFYRVTNARLCSMIVGDVDGNGIIDENDLNLLNSYLGYNMNIGLPQQTIINTTGMGTGNTTNFVNGYETLIQPFANLFSVQFQLVDPNTGLVVADGYDGVLVANPTNPRLAQFTSASVNFNTIIGLSSYNLVILTNTNQANYGGFIITSIDSVADVLTIQKVFLNEQTMGQLLRSDIDGDFVITFIDGYLLENYIERLPLSQSPTTTYPAPTTNPYTKIGTRFNVIELEVEQYVDRSDDYAANPATRATSVHPLPDIFLNDGYMASHDFYHFPLPITFVQELIWDDSLVVCNSGPKLVPSIFTSNTGFNLNSCLINGIQCEVYPVTQPFDPGRIDYFVPDNLIIGTGDLTRPDGTFYKVDFEVGTIVLEIPDGYFGTERTIDIFNDFIVDVTGNGATKLGFPSMRFADCTFVTSTALANDQIRFSVAVQSFSPNVDGYSTDGYYGAIVDGKMGVSIDYTTGLLTLNFSNLYQDQILQTLSTKIQINVFLKKGGFNNQPLFVNSTQVQNMLGMISVFSGANDGGPSALVDLGFDVTGILPIIHGGTGLNAVGTVGTVLASTGSGLSYQFINSLIGAIPFSTGIANANEIPETDGYGFLDPSFYYKNPVYIYGAAGIFSNDSSTPAPVGAFTFRFDSFILEGWSSFKLEAIIETTDNSLTAQAQIQLYSLTTHAYIPLTATTTTNNFATLVRSQDLSSVLLSGAADNVYEVHLSLNSGSGMETAICKMARLVITYNNLTLNSAAQIAPPLAYSYNFVPFLPSPSPS